MFKFKKKYLNYPVIIILSVAIIAVAIPATRPLALSLFKFPLKIISLINREVNAFVFFHRNFILSEKLSKENDILRRKLSEAAELSSENNRLKDLLRLKNASAFQVIAARVIGRSADNWSSLVIIDKGSRHGLKRGYIVINYLGLVGRLVEVSQTTAKVMLINDPNLTVSALSQRSRQEGLVSGTLGSALIMRYLPQDADIKVSDVIVTSGLTQIFPKGLIVGTVTDIGEEFSHLSRYAIIKPSVSLSGIEEVLVIIP